MTLEQLKLKWQKHNRDNGLSWNEVSLLVDDVVRVVMEKQRPGPEKEKLLKDFLYDRFLRAFKSEEHKWDVIFAEEEMSNVMEKLGYL